MAMSPREFWGLTVREFWIKHRAFTRAEDRQRALVLELALNTGEYKDSQWQTLSRAIHSLRRYPQKAWLNPPA